MRVLGHVPYTLIYSFRLRGVVLLARCDGVMLRTANLPEHRSANVRTVFEVSLAFQRLGWWLLLSYPRPHIFAL
jgi:hypothetical protein